MPSIDKEMIRYINIARQHPSYFIPLIQKQLQSFINEKQIPLNEEIIYQTNQGKKTWEECLNFLQNTNSMPPLEQHQGLNMSANAHAKDLIKNGIFGHTGSDGSSFSERILRYCKKGHGSMAELIGADFKLENRNHPEMTILGLLIDDGVLDRGHRKTIFNPSYKYIGSKSQVQGQKIITVFNITQNKLSIRGQSNNQSALNVFGVRSSSNSFKSPSKINQKTEFDEGRFYQTDFNLKKPSNDKPKSYFQSHSNNNSQINKLKSPEKSVIPSENLQQSKNAGTRKLCEKKESSKVYYKDNCKVTQITTQLIYNDGTVQEKTDKHTIYM